MSKNLSVAEILANLEARISHHQERKTFHAAQEAHHRDQHALHDAELQKILQRYEAFKAASEAASDYAQPPAPATPPDAAPKAEEIPLFGDRPMVSRLIARVVESQKEGETFGARAIAKEVNRRYGDKLERPVKTVAVSVVLRRLRDTRKIQEVRSGKAAHEGLYVRSGRRGGG